MSMADQTLDVGDSVQHGEVRLQIKNKPSTDKKQDIVQAVVDSLSEIPFEGNLGEFTNNLIDHAYDSLSESEVDTQKAYVWQTYGECVHMEVDTSPDKEEAREENGNPSDMAEIIRELDEDEFERFQEGMELDDEEYMILQRGRAFAQKSS